MKDILITAVSTGAILGFIQFLITRHDGKDEDKKAVADALNKINEQLKKNEKDTLRTQLLLLILLQPNEQSEILKVGEHYFRVLKGNWYMTNVFAKWCKKHDLDPDWFETE